MPKAIAGIPQHQLWTLSREELGYLSDRLFSRSVSDLTIDTPNTRRDMLFASRAISRLIRMYERASQRELRAIMLGDQ